VHITANYIFCCCVFPEVLLEYLLYVHCLGIAYKKINNSNLYHVGKTVFFKKNIYINEGK